jgi:hypothetical protein
VLGGIAAGFSILIVLARCGLLSSPALILVSLALYPIGSVGLASRLFRRIATRVVAPTPRHCWPEAGADLCELQVTAERPCSDA